MTKTEKNRFSVRIGSKWRIDGKLKVCYHEALATGTGYANCIERLKRVLASNEFINCIQKI